MAGTQYTGQRIIDQGFDLFYRLMTGGTLPERKSDPCPRPDHDKAQTAVRNKAHN